ncbi:hypothetical protein GCM10029964_075630 [Kibdelosporangium lantanae]
MARTRTRHRRRTRPALDLFEKTITTVEIRDDGALTLTFDDGGEMFVGVDAQFESWHLSGQGVDNILVGPGGHADWQRPD